MLTVVTHHWGNKYGPEYVARLQSGVARHLKQDHRFLVATPVLGDEPLLPGCMVRLKMFDPAWQKDNGIEGRLISMDLDSIVTGPLDDLFEGAEPFKILLGANASNPCRMNGSIWYVDAGFRPDVWTDFSLEAAAKAPHFAFPDDQSWMDFKMPDAAGWQVGAASGIYAFAKPGWPKGDALPKDARIVAFPGWRDPSKFVHLSWVKANWW